MSDIDVLLQETRSFPSPATFRATARVHDSRLHDDDDLRARGASDAWLEGRRALAIDGRPLRPPRECPRA